MHWAGILPHLRKSEKLLVQITHLSEKKYFQRCGIPAIFILEIKLKLSVSSKAPSGKGFFIDQGRESGIRDEMLFLVQKADVFNEIPLFFEIYDRRKQIFLPRDTHNREF